MTQIKRAQELLLASRLKQSKTHPYPGINWSTPGWKIDHRKIRSCRSRGL